MTTPKIVKLSHTPTRYDESSFTISGIDKSFVNAIRRTVLSEIPTVVILGSSIDISENSSRLHNEILKHRLGCIPVYGTGSTLREMQQFAETYEFVLDVSNPSSPDILDVTTEHFVVREKGTGKVLSRPQQLAHFPPDPLTRDFILFTRLRPRVGQCSGTGGTGGTEDDEDTQENHRPVTGGGGGGGGGGGEFAHIPCEKVRLNAGFGVSCARENAMYNVVSKCKFRNTVDKEAGEDEWTKREHALQLQEGITMEEIAFAKKNFFLLDAERLCIPNSFEFTVQSLGMLENMEIVKMACEILIAKLQDIHTRCQTNAMTMIAESNTTLEFGFDIRLDGEDDSVGRMIEFIGYEKYYRLGRRADDPATGIDKVLSFCGFVKVHPHNTFSIIRLGFSNPTTREEVVTVFGDTVHVAIKVMEKIYRLFT